MVTIGEIIVTTREPKKTVILSEQPRDVSRKSPGNFDHSFSPSERRINHYAVRLSRASINISCENVRDFYQRDSRLSSCNPRLVARTWLRNIGLSPSPVLPDCTRTDNRFLLLPFVLLDRRVLLDDRRGFLLHRESPVDRLSILKAAQAAAFSANFVSQQFKLGNGLSFPRDQLIFPITFCFPGSVSRRRTLPHAEMFYSFPLVTLVFICLGSRHWHAIELTGENILLVY